MPPKICQEFTWPLLQLRSCMMTAGPKRMPTLHPVLALVEERCMLFISHNYNKAKIQFGHHLHPWKLTWKLTNNLFCQKKGVGRVYQLSTPLLWFFPPKKYIHPSHQVTRHDAGVALRSLRFATSRWLPAVQSVKPGNAPTTWRIIPGGCKELGSPPFISRKKGHVAGVPQPYILGLTNHGC